MKTTTTIIIITALTRIDLLINLINNSSQLISKNHINMNTNLQIQNPLLYWIIQIIITIIIYIIVYQIFKRIADLKDELIMSNIVNRNRNIITLKEQYKNHEYYLLPNESIEEFNKRNLNGVFDKKMQEEINLVYKDSLNVFKNKSVNEIEELIHKIYDLK